MGVRFNGHFLFLFTIDRAGIHAAAGLAEDSIGCHFQHFEAGLLIYLFHNCFI